jgi:endo-1,4-beta-xylanase
MRPTTIQSCALTAVFLMLACSSELDPDGGSPSNAGGTSGSPITTPGGTTSGATTHAGAGGSATSGTGGGLMPIGGSPVGGTQSVPSGGVSTGGTGVSMGGAGGSMGGRGFGGRPNGGAGGASGGNNSGGSGGTGTSSGGVPALDCNAAMPTNGTKHTGDGRGGKDNLAWELWANSPNNGSITTFPTPSFESDWNNAGDFLARIGYEWGNSGKSYDTYGKILAQLAYKKSGSAGGYSYIGIYGWTTNPCVEWYIVDDSFNQMPVNPGNTSNKGTVKIDDGDYILYTRQTTGTGGSRCNGVSNWAQYYSVRKTGRQCGTITISDHFDAWKAASMPLGNLLEAKILVEVGGGSGSVQFPVANVMINK